MSTHHHSNYMKSALQLAGYGRYSVSPNPMVGCVIVNHNEVVGEGYHQQAGGPHAEVIALQNAGSKAKGADAYVTLEPCCHYGRTPPCTKALIEAGIKKIYIACLDPNPLVAGKGLQELKAAGIEVELGLCQNEAVALNEIFFHFIRTKKPFVIAKWAMSLDGKTITHQEDSPDISSLKSREFSHQTRQQVDAILIGSKTAVQDNPLLTVRYPTENTHQLKQPIRILLSSHGDLPADLRLFDSSLPAKTIVATTNKVKSSWVSKLEAKNVEVLVLPGNSHSHVDINYLLSALGERGVSSLLIEGGMTVLHEFFNENLVNKVHVYLAPKIIGSLKQKQQWVDLTIANIDEDFFITAVSEENKSCLLE